MTDLDYFLLFNACEDAREESERKNGNDDKALCYDDDDSSWSCDSLDDNDDE